MYWLATRRPHIAGGAGKDARRAYLSLPSFPRRRESIGSERNLDPAFAGMTHPFPIAATPKRLALGRMRHILSIIAWPNPEQETCVAPGMSRAKS